MPKYPPPAPPPPPPRLVCAFTHLSICYNYSSLECCKGEAWRRNIEFVTPIRILQRPKSFPLSFVAICIGYGQNWNITNLSICFILYHGPCVCWSLYFDNFFMYVTICLVGFFLFHICAWHLCILIICFNFECNLLIHVCHARCIFYYNG